MTGTRDSQQDGSIREVLSDSGLEPAAELRTALEQLRTLVPDAAPAPRADLAALLGAGAPGSAGHGPATTTALPSVASVKDPDVESLPAGVTNLAERRGRKRRLAIVGGAVVGVMTLGAGAVAASSEDFRRGVSHTVGVIFLPSGHATPTPEHVQPSPVSVPAVPAPAATSPADVPGAAPSGARTPGTPGRPHTSPATPPAVGRGGVLPTPGQRPEMPGLPASPGVPGGGGDAGGGEKEHRVPGRVAPALPDDLPTNAPSHP